MGIIERAYPADITRVSTVIAFYENTGNPTPVSGDETTKIFGVRK